MSHVFSTYLVDALRGAEELPTDQQQAVQTACVAGQRHLQVYNQARLSAAEAARAGHRLQAQEYSNLALSSLRAAQSELRSAWDLLGNSEANRCPTLGIAEELPLELVDLQLALENHYAHGHLGPGNHVSHQAFNDLWIAMLQDLADRPPATLQAIRVRDLPTSRLPRIPPYELQFLALGTVTARPMFIAPDLPQARAYGDALQQLPESEEQLTELFIMPCGSFLTKFGIDQLIEFVHTLHTQGRPAILGIFLEEVDRPGHGRMLAVPQES